MELIVILFIGGFIMDEGSKDITTSNNDLAVKLRQAEIEVRKNNLNEKAKQEPGEKNWKGFGFDINPQVTFISIILLVAFITITLMFPSQAETVFEKALSLITKNAGWFFIMASNLFIIAGLVFAFGKFGNIKIGGRNAVPDFSKFSWYAMLLSAGMGIGLLFWSVAEPIIHLSNPSPFFDGIQPGSPKAVQAAMSTTFFHWGVHPWGIYAIVGLAIAFFTYNKGLPLTIKSVFYPLIGNKIYGFWGNVIDVFAVLATLAGLATSLGFGVSQVNAGLNFLFGINISVTVQVLLIIGITFLATISVVLGLDGGVKKLSEINMILAGLFLIFIILVGPTIYLLSGFIENFGYYLSNLLEMSLWTETFKDSSWQGSWTVFYWAWWISWSPFVGIFIARISKGRTIKEFILGVMLIPTLISFIWMSVFGGTAIFLETKGIADIVSFVDKDVSIALFAMLENLPLTKITSFIGIILVTVFFITSSDSGSLVVNYLTSDGKLESPIPQRIFWASMEGVVASTLLIGGGLAALQTATLITGLPFAFILILMIFSLRQGLQQEYELDIAIKEKLAEVRENHVIEETIK